MRKFLLLIMTGMWLCFAILAAPFAEAAETVKAGGIKGHVVGGLIFETLSKENKEDIRTLRGEYDEKFKEALKEKLAERKKELALIKEEDPQKFEEIMGEARRKMKKHVNRFREKHSQRFEELKKGNQERVKETKKKRIQQGIVFETLAKSEQEKILKLRKKYQNTLKEILENKGEELKALEEKDPEKFKEIIKEAKQKVKGRIRQGRKYRSEEFDKLKKIKLEYLKMKLKWLKDDDPEFYEELIDKIEEQVETRRREE